MKFKRITLETSFIFLCIYSLALSVQALRSSPTFKLGDTCLPMDEDGFIEYDFDSETAPALEKIEMKVLDIYQFGVNPPILGVNLSVSKLNPNNNEHEALIIDSLEFDNQTCLLCNRSVQYFRFGENMEKLLTNGYGGFFMVPCNPVNISIIKDYIDTFTFWSASVVENTITLEINNDQAILQYNDQGILIKEEIISAGQIVSTLSITSSNEPKISLGGLFPLILIITVIGLIIINKKKTLLSP